MKGNSEYKNEALHSLEGNWGQAVLASLVVLAIALVFNGSGTWLSRMSTSVSNGFLALLGSSGVLALVFLTGPVSIGFSNAFRALQRSGNPNIVQNTLHFAFENYLHNVWVYLVMEVKILLWTLLFVVPGIIKSFAYILTPYIAVEHPDWSASECIAHSESLMEGHKAEMFSLYLSFIGWLVLCIITAGIGFLWVGPYLETAKAAFYAEIKNEI